MNVNEFGYDEIAEVAARIRLTRTDVLRLIRHLATCDGDTYLDVRLTNTVGDMHANITAGGGIGEILPVDAAKVWVRNVVTA